MQLNIQYLKSKYLLKITLLKVANMNANNYHTLALDDPRFALVDGRTRPEFMLVGGMKCGSTSFARYLSAHPQVKLRGPKEPHYWSCHRFPARYQDFFVNESPLLDPGPGQCVSGEFSTSSLIHPLVILFTIPLALVGAVLALYVTGTTVNVVAFIGVIMLAGIVVNNAIVLVDLINQLRAQGKECLDAILEAGSARLRPILMTSLTTTLGLLPMAMGFGEGSEVRTPMAITVIGGLTVSTFLTLVVIPVVYSLMDRK